MIANQETQQFSQMHAAPQGVHGSQPLEQKCSQDVHALNQASVQQETLPSISAFKQVGDSFEDTSITKFYPRNNSNDSSIQQEVFHHQQSHHGLSNKSNSVLAKRERSNSGDEGSSQHEADNDHYSKKQRREQDGTLPSSPISPPIDKDAAAVFQKSPSAQQQSLISLPPMITSQQLQQQKDQEQQAIMQQTPVAPARTLRQQQLIGAEPALSIVTGFNKPPSEKVPGGKDNRKPIPPQVLRLDTNQLNEAHKHRIIRAMQSPQQLPLHPENVQYIMRATLMGYKRLSVNREEMSLAVLDQGPISRGAQIVQTPHIILFPFDALVVNFSSHNHGQKLFIRFSLIEAKTDVELASTDTSAFETITKRGIEKQIRKMKKSDGPNSENSPTSAGSTGVNSSIFSPSNSSNGFNHVASISPAHFYAHVNILGNQIQSPTGANAASLPQFLPLSPKPLPAGGAMNQKKEPAMLNSPLALQQQKVFEKVQSIMQPQLMGAAAITAAAAAAAGFSPNSPPKEQSQQPQQEEKGKEEDVDICYVLLSLKNQN